MVVRFVVRDLMENVKDTMDGPKLIPVCCFGHGYGTWEFDPRKCVVYDDSMRLGF
jgi:hypothetical protein